MSKTIPSLYYPADITWPQLLFVVIPASILGVVLFTITVTIMGVWQFSSWLLKLTEGLSIYSHQQDYVIKEPINDRPRTTQTDRRN